jgi:hypothetical protein
MVRITLADTDYLIETLSGGEKETFHIAKGVYNGKRYLAVVVTGDAVILEGDENLHLKEKAAAVYIRQRSVLEQAADFLKSDGVYLDRSNAVPEGKERDLLRHLMG